MPDEGSTGGTKRQTLPGRGRYVSADSLMPGTGLWQASEALTGVTFPRPQAPQTATFRSRSLISDR